MDLILGYLAGVLTLINPCVLPVLPIVLASALQAGRRGPALLATGMALSFLALGFGVTAFGRAVGLDAEALSRAGAWVMILFGAVLLVPRASAAFATASAGLSARADARLGHGSDPRGEAHQFVAGLLLGAVWSPCIGPTLGGAIGLASQGERLGQAFAVMVAFAAGVATLILALAYGARAALTRNRAALMRLATLSRPVMGGVFVLVGAAILLGWTHLAEAWLLDHLPYWLTDLSVKF